MIKSLKDGLLGFFFILAFVFIAAVIIVGTEWVSLHLQPLFTVLTYIALIFQLLIVLPMFAIKKTRLFSASAMVVISYIYGATLWINGFLITLELWGAIGVVIGLLFAGFGVVPIAIIGSIISGHGNTVFALLFLTALTFGSRIIGNIMISKQDENEEYI